MRSLISTLKRIPQHPPIAISARLNLRRLHQSLLLFSLTILLTACGGSGNQSTNSLNADSQNANQSANQDANQSASQSNPADDTEPAATAEFTSADISLSWQAPLSREDGSALPITAIAGYEISYENSRQETTVITLNNAESNSYKINDLPPDDYQFAVFAFDTNNTISDASPLIHLQRTDFPRL